MRLSRLPALVLCCTAIGAHAAGIDAAAVERSVEQVVRPLMAEHGIPGMSVAVTAGGKDYVYSYGIASRQGRQAVTNDTLFEIGSISKTFTGTLAARAEANGALRLSDSPVKYLPALRGTALDKVTLLHLATHTAGGLPLQVPDAMRDDDTMHAYFRTWQPAFAPGARRVYSNPGIGLLGMATAAATGVPFETAVEQYVFRPLGMKSSFYQVPDSRTNDYAQGYTRTDIPARMTPGLFWAEAYGVKSTAADMLRFVKANMQDAGTHEPMRHAMTAAQRGYFRAGGLHQGLAWEHYPWPVDAGRLLDGNGDVMVFQAVDAVRLDPPAPPANTAAEILVNKTGSTNGFAAYVAFIPSRRLGIVMLANKNYPAPARVSAAHEVLTTLDAPAGREGAR